MNRNLNKWLWFLFRFFIIYCSNHIFIAEGSVEHQQPTDSETRLEVFHKNNKEESVLGEDRISKLETKSQHQEMEIALLKNGAANDRKTIDQLTSRVVRLESELASAHDNVLQRPKRPFRLFTANFQGENEKLGAKDENTPFYGPATNCHQLGKLGYTLNGYYFVKGDASKIRAVFCGFQQQYATSKSITETFIGDLEIKSKSVHFYVKRESLLKANGTVSFEVEELNVGKAMNLATGLFTAPVNGIYHFEFSALKYSDKISSFVHLYVNGVKIGSSYADAHDGHYIAHSGISASLRLSTGDRVWLNKTSGVLDDYENDHFTHFTGWLMEEDLMLA